MTPAALLFDFDGVLIESEAASNRQIAETLTALGYPTSFEQSVDRFMGRADKDFLAALESYLGIPVPAAFHEQRQAADARIMAEGIGEVAGAVAFVRALPPDLPRAVVSSSSTRWIARHLAHLGLTEEFGSHLYSGGEHVARGKPAPDLYLHAAARLGVPIAACAVIEDSVIGATGAVASGARVIGLCAGTHCRPGHADRLRAVGVRDIAGSYDEVRALLGFA